MLWFGDLASQFVWTLSVRVDIILHRCCHCHPGRCVSSMMGARMEMLPINDNNLPDDEEQLQNGHAPDSGGSLITIAFGYWHFV